jgi:hypothetical protein
MNHPDERDTLALFESVPMPSAYASDPCVFANERRVLLVYRIAPSDYERFGPFNDDEEPFCLVHFTNAAFHQSGPPNDEGLGMHPLAAKGLRWYSAYECLNPTLVDELWPAYPGAAPHRHFIFTFQDSTFECIAADCDLAGVYGSSDIAVREAFALMG